jgi:hypothetical protein
MLKRIRDPRHADYFQYLRLTDGSAPAVDPRIIDVAVLDMNHSWPNIGHDALVHAVLEGAQEVAVVLRAAGCSVRVLSFDIRRRAAMPDAAARFGLFLGTGGPGHLDPRLNDGLSEWSQGISESASWEAPLFRLFDDILASEDTAMLAVCHTFGLLCRWSGIARVELRGPEKGGKSSGMPLNVLSDAGAQHPWFSKFAAELPDHRHFRVVDSRLFDLIPLSSASPGTTISYESTPDGSAQREAMTSVEFARDPSGMMPRFFAVNHHPEIVDHDRVMTVLEEKYAAGEVTKRWYEERFDTLCNEFVGDRDRQSRLTSRYMLLAPIAFHVARLVHRRCAELGVESSVRAT